MKKILLFILVIIAFISCQQGSESTEEEQSTTIELDLPERPNILWLVAEDLGPYLPSFGDSTITTPNLSRLAAEGVCYDNVFSPSPVCSPSRAAISTGMYPVTIAANHMRTGPWYMSGLPEKTIKEYTEKYLPKEIQSYEAQTPPSIKMMSEYLREIGYYCTNNAKEDYQYQKTITAWDESSRTAHWKNRKEGQPFFAIFNYGVTHESQIWGRAEDSLWVDENLEVPVPPYLPDNEVGQRDVRRMYSNIRMMDHQVGQMLQELEDAGELENTIIVWYTDHGGPLPRQKRLLYDSGLRVPMIIRYPNKQAAGQRDDQLISFIDFAPTTLSLVGIQPPAEMNGQAFLGKYKRTENPKYIFAAADRFDESYDKNRAVRDKQFKYIRYYNTEKPMFLPIGYREQMAVMQELHRLKEAEELTEAQALWFRATKPKEELFDITNDPHEINNLANDPKYANKLKELRTANEQWQKDYVDLGMMEETALLKKLWQDGKQPVVATPTIINENGKISLATTTEGASIGYKIIQDDVEYDKPFGDWMVYTEPFELPEGAGLKVVADRIGYKISEVNHFEK